MRTTLVTLAVITLIASAGAEAPKYKAAFDPAKLVGAWTLASGERAGEKIEKDHLPPKVTFTKETVTVPAGPDQRFLIAYKVDAKARPVAIDMQIKEGPVNEGKALGILEPDGDGFKLCYVVDDGNAKRPVRCESTKDNNAFLFVLRPAKK